MNITLNLKTPLLTLTTSICILSLSFFLLIKSKHSTPTTYDIEMDHRTQVSHHLSSGPKKKMKPIEITHFKNRSDLTEVNQSTNTLAEHPFTSPTPKGQYADWDDHYAIEFEAAEAHYQRLVQNMTDRLGGTLTEGFEFNPNELDPTFPSIKWQEAQHFIDQLSLPADLDVAVQSDQDDASAHESSHPTDRPSGIQTIEETPFHMDMREFDRIFNGLSPKDRVHFQLAVMEKMNMNDHKNYSNPLQP